MSRHTLPSRRTTARGPRRVDEADDATTDDERLIRERLVEYFTILQEWSLKVSANAPAPDSTPPRHEPPISRVRD